MFPHHQWRTSCSNPSCSSSRYSLAQTLAAAETTERPTRIEIGTHIDLPHPAESIRQVLADLAAYPEWNPYHARVEGAAERGARLEVEVHKPNGHRLVIHPRVIVAEPDRSLVWGGGVPGTFRGVHRFDLEPCPKTAPD
jgi:uncharacterized membrane protein